MSAAVSDASLIGAMFGFWRVDADLGSDPKLGRILECTCTACGRTTKRIRLSKLRRGLTSRCRECANGRALPRNEDGAIVLPERVGEWRRVGEAAPDRFGKRRIECVCGACNISRRVMDLSEFLKARATVCRKCSRARAAEAIRAAARAKAPPLRELYGSWQVLRELPPEASGHQRGGRVVECLCLECNETTQRIEVSRLTNGATSRCRRCADKRAHRTGFGRVYFNTKREADFPKGGGS